MTPAPSPFYDLFEGAEPFLLVFPACDFAGPFWDDEGNLVRRPDDEMAGERIEAVRLGPCTTAWRTVLMARSPA